MAERRKLRRRGVEKQGGEQQRLAPSAMMKELGASGLEHWSGRISEEWLRQLQQEKGVRIYREMVDNDPVVGAMLFAIEMLIRQVSWYVTPGSEEEQDVEAAEFVESCLYDMNRAWGDVVAEVLSFLPFGWSYHETTYKRRLGPEQKDASKRSRFNDGRIGWRKISVRAQETRDRWELDEKDGSIRGMWQIDPQSGKDIFIPIEKALLFRTSTKKNNPEGRSVLRNAFRPWFFKKRIEEIEGIGIERDLAGLPIAYVPAEIMLDDADNEKKAVFSAIKDIVRNIRRDEQEGVVFPGDRDEDGERIYELSLLSTGGQRQFDTSKIITRYDQRIAMTLLADFILLGHEKVGSFALSDSKTAMFATATGTFMDIIAQVFNAHAIPRLLRLNGMSVEAMPELQHGDIETPDLEKLGNYVKNLTGSGMPLFPDDDLENELRSAAGWPKKPEGGSEEEMQRQEQEESDENDEEEEL